MKSMQLRGPFTKGRKFSVVPEEGSIVHIGIECGRVLPLAISDEPVINIEGVDFRINETCMLEWGDFSDDSITITPLIDLDEYTLIDVAYE